MKAGSKVKVKISDDPELERYYNHLFGKEGTVLGLSKSKIWFEVQFEGSRRPYFFFEEELELVK
jgi:hypothetical protein